MNVRSLHVDRNLDIFAVGCDDEGIFIDIQLMIGMDEGLVRSYYERVITL
jgi:hypothetical protein